MAAATWVAEVDWNNDLDYSDTGETVTTRVQHRDGITTVRGRDTIRALSPPAAGSCDFTLNNASKDYSPENASSPLYGNLTPGRRVRIRTTAPSATNIWKGNLDDLPQQPLLRGGFVKVPALGTLAKLKGTKVSCYLRTNITTSAALAVLFAAAGLAASEYQFLDTGKTTLTLWWCGDDDAFDMMTRILAAEGPGAAIYEDGSGVITFHSRHYRLLTTRCTVSQATFGNASTEPKHAPPFGYQPNLKGVVNQAAITTKVGTLAGSATTVWTWTGSIQCAVGTPLYFDINLSEPAEQFTSAITFDTGGLLTTIGNYDDGGANPAKGTRVYLQVINNSAGGQTVTITAISVSAKVYSSATEIVRNTADTSASQAKYGSRALPTSYNPWPYIDSLVARDFADAIVGAYKEPRASVDITVNNGHATRLTHQLAREISDRVTVQESQTGMNGAVIIERIRHEIKAGGRDHKTTFSCEKVGAHDNWLIWDVGTWDTNLWAF